MTTDLAANETSTWDTSLETSRSMHVGALVFAMLLPTVATLLYFVVLSGSESMKVVYFGSKIVQFAFPLFWVCIVQGRKLKLARPTSASIVSGLAMGAAIVAVGLIAYFGYFKSSPYLANAPSLVGEKVADMGLRSPLVYGLFALFLAVTHSLYEEYYWLWFAFGQLRRITPTLAAMVISSLGFMAHHVIVIHQFLQQGWAITLFLSLCVAFGGFLWAWLYSRSRSLYGPWVSHLLVDCGIMYIGFNLVKWNGG